MTAATKEQECRVRRSRPHSAAAAAGVPYTMRLADGRTLFVEVPARMTSRDRSGEVAFTPEGVRFLDRLRALASDMAAPPSPAFIVTLRAALGLTQEQFGRGIGVHKLTVSRWECGTLRPGAQAIQRLRALARAKKRAGVALPG